MNGQNMSQCLDFHCREYLFLHIFSVFSILLVISNTRSPNRVRLDLFSFSQSGNIGVFLCLASQWCIIDYQSLMEMNQKFPQIVGQNHVFYILDPMLDPIFFWKKQCNVQCQLLSYKNMIYTWLKQQQNVDLKIKNQCNITHHHRYVYIREKSLCQLALRMNLGIPYCCF